MLVASSALFLVLLLSVLFASYLPGKQRVGRLEAGLKEVQAPPTPPSTEPASQLRWR